MNNISWNSWFSNIKCNGDLKKYGGSYSNELFNNGYKYYNNQFLVEYNHKKLIGRPNRLLYFEVIQTKIKITTHVLYSVLCIYGEITKIFVYKKHGQYKGLVEFLKEENATKVFATSNYLLLEYFTLKVEYAKTSSLTVKKNDEFSWDYTKSPLLNYVDGDLSTPKSSHLVNKVSGEMTETENDTWTFITYSAEKIKNVSKIQHTWETVENINVFEAITSNQNFLTEITNNKLPVVKNKKKRTKYVPFSNFEKRFVISVSGFDPAKTNCNKLFRILSLYTPVTKIKFLQEQNSAEVEIGELEDISKFAQLQQTTLPHGNHFSFQYLKGSGSKINCSIDSFNLPDGSPSYATYNMQQQMKVNSEYPSKIVRFYGAPLNIKNDELISIIKQYIPTDDFTVILFRPKEDSKSIKSTAGEIHFSTVAEAIEFIMITNYLSFHKKDRRSKNNQEEYVLRLMFHSLKVLP